MQGNYEQVSQFNLAFAGTLMPSDGDSEENKVIALKENGIHTENPSQSEAEVRSIHFILFKSQVIFLI